MDKLKMRANSRRLLVKYCRRHSVWYDAGIEMLLLLLLLFGESGNIEAQGAASVAWPESATDMNQGGPSTFRRRLAEQTDASHSYKALAGGDSEGFRVPARIENRKKETPWRTEVVGWPDSEIGDDDFGRLSTKSTS
uniref:Uncharacterized protein B9G16.50 n=1 Tax=Neurospora crassa TaxID=5141 RepID=Q8WZR4_NEUCS|nr:hypothetical protein [Neurospora crassa]